MLPQWLKVESLRNAGQWLLRAVPAAAVEFKEHLLRWSYIAVAGLVVLAAIANFTLPHGWTAWPFVAMAAILMYLHEAADRNGQGVPPGQVYLFFAGALVGWIVLSALLAAVNPLITLVGIGFLVYYCLRAYLRDREARRVISDRRAAGRCIFCGEVADPTQGVCLHCGEEPDPEQMQTARIQAIVKNRSGNKSARQTLTTETLAAAARKKEASLLAKSALRARRKS